jgi:tryptophanyl-tRNA synthetase
MTKQKDFIVTPWEVSGEVDYDRLLKDFGVEKISSELMERLKSHAGELHMLLERGLFFAHRDLDWILGEREEGNDFHLYTGRGPSGQTHLGHLVPWFLTKWLQDKFGARLLFQMTDDEKFLFNQDLELEETNRLAYENALDVIALGFDPDKTEIFSDIDYSKTLYPHAVRVAKKITFSTTRAVFGLRNESNIGQIFFSSVQAVPAFLESVRKGKNIPCLIPHAIDQDPYFRVARDVLPRLGYYKPASIQGRFLPGLAEGGKMSASIPESAIFTTDSGDVARKKVLNAFTGGQPTVDEQRKLGGNPDICPVYQYLTYIFEEDDRRLEEQYQKCRSGELLCGEHKQYLATKVLAFLDEHQKKRERARKVLEKFIVKD